MNKLLIPLLLTFSVGATSLPLHASDVAVPHQFSAGQKAVASDVNDNFTALAAELSTALKRIEALEKAQADADARIGDLEVRNAALEAADTLTDGRVALLETQTSSQEMGLETLTQSSVWAMEPFVQVIPDAYVPGATTVRFSGINLQLVDGSGTTHSTAGTENGLGNLIVGYNETAPGYVQLCNIGRHGDEMACISQGGVWSAHHKSGSHNFVLGRGHNYSASAGFVAGEENSITGVNSSISAGIRNVASGHHSSINGGRENRASGDISSIVGGHVNEASGAFSSVSGGGVNKATGSGSSILGGQANTASASTSTVLGGNRHEASASSPIAPNPLP